MTELVRPDVRLHPSWAEAVAEFGDAAMHGSGLWDFDPIEVDPSSLATYVDHLVAQGEEGFVPPEGRVPCTYFWIADRGQFVGYLAVRHSLNDWLLEGGGHIGFSVRPSRRREGHAGRALALALPHAARLGLERVLLTCDEDNDGSRLTIEHRGGVYEDSRSGKRRYWISLDASQGGTAPGRP